MKIHCNSCKQEFQIPDEKVKGLSKFAVKCPKCKEKIVVEKEAKDNYCSLDWDSSCLELEPENIPLGKLSALIFIKDAKLLTDLGDFLQERGYFLREVKSYEECKARLTLNNYNLIFLEEGEEADRLIEFINTWPQLRRRDSNLILVGEKGKDFDQKLSFAKSVNFYLNKNSGEFFLKLEKCLNDFQVYLSCWQQ